MHESPRAFPPKDLPSELESLDDPCELQAVRILHSLGYCGHYLHFHGGGRSGKAPILCLLEKRGGCMSQQELGLNFELKPGSLSEILTKLENGGFIERKRSENDRRQLIITLTEAGHERARSDERERIDFRRKAFSNLTESEQEELARLLELVRTRWEELDD